MTGFVCLESGAGCDGPWRSRLGHPLVDRDLELVAGQPRRYTLGATAFALKAFFAVIDNDREGWE
jgi:hypothetical protein